ncbi:GNAT family N-acetyltransferase [Deinococcus roseus]|uniref:N-acetyltransferase n=1 Tax=Deinococcus roseus TaxID=392414 RepID=A0ABQ2D0L7_9DEIO|nr:GNAT family N-acetyltransferase [Deinococcus roseus]GGJ39559.1 N-acetyltransferase [Deinococcus roseus]
MTEQETPKLLLRDVTSADLEVFFEHQKDPEARQMAAFTRPDPENRTAFDQHWQRILNNPENEIQTIEHDGLVVGQLGSFLMEGEREITYWLDRTHWGKNLATLALHLYLQKQHVRPLFARAAFDNVGSRRVLEKCGFQVVGEDLGFSEARDQETRELIFRLD